MKDLDIIESKIYLVQGKRVMLDQDLALLYGVETRVLIQAVKRQKDRFPSDFMFQLTEDASQNLRSQSVISSLSYGGRRYLPYVFTENGVAMLSSVLRSKRAIQVNIQIMRTFTRLREIIRNHEAIWKKLTEMEEKYDGQFQAIFDVIRQMVAEEENPKRKIGFHPS